MTPDRFTLKETIIDVGDGHKVYAQLWGTAQPKETIVFLHGGPGSGCNDGHKDLFDPTIHQVIFFDQRGSGKSVPYGSLRANDTDHLVEDITIISSFFSVDVFSLVGGSWGSLLGLTYALRYPNKIKRMVLRGIFTGRQSELDFMDKGEGRVFFPDVWQIFVDSVPKQYRSDPAAYHLPRVLGNDLEAAKSSAYAYSCLEGSIMSLDDRAKPPSYKEYDPVSTIIECHYLANHCFLAEGYIVQNASQLTIPVDLVQGRYDLVCPPYTAYELDQKLPNSHLIWTTAGHSGNDRANWQAVKTLLLS